MKKSTKIHKEIKIFVNEYDWEGINFPSEKNDWKKVQKNNVSIAIIDFYAKKEKYILLMFQNITQIVKNNLFF